MRPQPYARRPAGAVNTREACTLAGIHRYTLWKWIYEDGLRFWRDPEYPHGYYYARADLRAVKLSRARRRIARPNPPPDAFDYS